jgi:hypothetical protein
MLGLASMAIDVNPPRARRLSARMPGLWSRFWFLRQAIAYHFPSFRSVFQRLFSRFDDADFRIGTILRAIVPGWAHSYRGNRPRAVIFFVSFFALFIPALLFFGTSLGSILIGLAFAMHVAASSDALVGQFATIGSRVLFALGCAVVLGLGIYEPVARLVSHHAIPIQVNQNVPPFAAGEVLWYSPSAQAEPGDYVLYRVPETAVAGQINGHHARYEFRNQWINRVVALAGQHVIFKARQLYVDGALSAWQPTVGEWSDFESDFKVPAGNLFIPPDSLIPTAAEIREAAWHHLCLVPESNIVGRIFFRSQPLWRMSRIKGSD